MEADMCHGKIRQLDEETLQTIFEFELQAQFSSVSNMVFFLYCVTVHLSKKITDILEILW